VGILASCSAGKQRRREYENSLPFRTEIKINGILPPLSIRLYGMNRGKFTFIF
jgi:hypothetical protein